MYCPNCGSELNDDDVICPYCGTPLNTRPTKPKDKNGLLLLLIGLTAVLLLAALFLLFRDRLIPTPDSGAAPTAAPTAAPVVSSTPVPLVPATNGTSTAGTNLQDIVYDAQGRLWLVSEQVNGIWYRWEYVYDNYGNFRYRARSIGAQSTKWSGMFMPGTDITYCVLNTAVDNCVGLTIEYTVTKVTKGNGLGRRDLYIQTDGGSWQRVGAFDYPSYSTVTSTVLLDQPTRLQAFATPRQHPDDSGFTVDQRLTEVWIADYNNVTLVTPMVPAP